MAAAYVCLQPPGVLLVEPYTSAFMWVLHTLQGLIVIMYSQRIIISQPP